MTEELEKLRSAVTVMVQALTLLAQDVRRIADTLAANRIDRVRAKDVAVTIARQSYRRTSLNVHGDGPGINLETKDLETKEP